MRSVLDTSVLVDLPLDAAGLPADLREDEAAISAVSLAELSFGVAMARDPEQRMLRQQRLSRISQAFEPLPVDASIADAYGEMAAAVRAAGRQPRARALDLLIAATALVHGARLVTHHVEDFRGLEHLLVVRRPTP